VELIEVHTTSRGVTALMVIPGEAASLFELGNLLQLANRNLPLVLVRILEIEILQHWLAIFFYNILIEQVDDLECTGGFFPFPLVGAQSSLTTSSTRSRHVGCDVHL
jgi:hypothetical protein